MRASSMRGLMSAAVLGACVAGCAVQSPVAAPEAEARSYDGLYVVQPAAMDRVWARVDLDLSGYDAILPEPAGIRYRPVPRDSEQYVALDDGQRARIAEAMRVAFERELARSERFAIADTVGPRVLIVRGELLDVVANLPAAQGSGSSAAVLRLGEATLLVELVDSTTGSVLVRAVDRAAISASAESYADPAALWSALDAVATDWARLVRRRLDELDARLTID